MASRKIALDLSKFKHVKSDKDSTTLRHKDGHELTIAHSKLTRDFQKQLAAMSTLAGKDGGATQADQEEAQAEAPQKLADGGQAKKPDTSNISDWVSRPLDTAKQGIKNVSDNVTAPPSAPSGHGQLTNDRGSYACGGVAKMAEGGDPGQYTDQLTAQSGNGMMSVNPEIAAKQKAVATDLKDAAAQKSQQQSDKDVYNMLLNQRGASPDQMFGPNGEMPQGQINPQLWQQAKNAPDDQRMQVNQMRMGWQQPMAQRQQREHDSLQEQNSIRQELGQQPLPDPGAPVLDAQDQAPTGDQLPKGPAQGGPIQGTGSPIAQQQDGMMMGTDPESMLASGYKNQMAGIQAGAKAQTQMAQEQAAVYQHQQQVMQDTQDHYQQSYNDLNKEREGLIKDVQNGYIDPEQYWKGVKDPVTGETHGGHSKIMSMIGILLGGAAVGATGHNPAVDQLRYQMDKNLEAQSKNLQAKDNLLGHNLRQFGNLKDGVMMTRIMQNDMLANQIQQSAAKASGPMAQAAAQQAIGQLQQQNAPLFQQFAMRRAMMNMANGSNMPGGLEHMLQYMRVMNPEMAKEMETRMVPGIGNNGASAMASVPVPEAVRQQIVTTKSINDLMNKALQFAQQHRGSVDPRVRAEGEAIHGQLIGMVKQAQHDGVYKPSEAEFLTDQIGGSPASMFANMSAVPKIRTMQQIKQSEYGNLLKTYGIAGAQLPQFQPASSVQQLQQAQAWLKANPNHPQAAAVKERIKAMSGK